MSKIRDEIQRIAAEPKGPWTPTLILGESGTGKEEVARTLYETSERGKRHPNAFASVACGSFTESLLQDQLFGHRRGAFNDAIRDRKGLLETQSAGALLLNDFETAPQNIQGLLLGILATPRKETARFFRLGEEGENTSNTDVWLLFSTNADIQKLIEANKLREDFIFRIEDRVIYIRPLRDRPADLPAIACHIWTDLWPDDGERKRLLSTSVLRWLCKQQTSWKGNVRALRALLSLTASMAKMPAHNVDSLRRILGEIMARGPEYPHWVGIIAAPSFSDPIPLLDKVIEEVRNLDQNDNCTPNVEKRWPGTGSETDARERLTPEGQEAFEKLLKEKTRTSSQAKIRRSIRLSRAICYLSRSETVDRNIYVTLNEIGDTIADAELKALEKNALLKIKQTGSNTTGPAIYERESGMIKKSPKPRTSSTSKEPNV